MPITIRPAAESDLPALAALELACFSHPWSEKSLAATLGSGRSLFLLAEQAGEPLGYLGMEYVLDEGGITNVAVFPAYRRRGIAHALIKELLRRAGCLGLATVTLEVRAGNTAAIALYQKNNFVPVGRRKNYYTAPTEDAILMTVTL
ncbi:MAG TPA: ribosomal-protein-alanine N-acetyltransferase [Ruminococcaceae bacterium]|nr:ribosomal-protein-alanine N-acetyltransferase [Oscillospiraceae bacterium]